MTRYTTTLSVSCIVPTHDRDAELTSAVASIRAQTYPADRIVVVDDTGRDPARPSMRSILGLDASVEYADASGMISPGASSSRNRGALGAETDLLAFLDDDDTWQPTFLEKAVNVFATHAPDMVVTWAKLVRGEREFPANWRARGDLTSRDVVAHNPGVTGSNFVIRRDVFERIGGFDPEMTVWNDLDFFVRFLEAGGTYEVIEQDLVTQRITAGTHLSSRSERRAAGIERYLRKHEALLDSRKRRTIRRAVHVARMHRGQSPGLYLRNAAAAIASSSRADWVEAVRRRLQRSTYS